MLRFQMGRQFVFKVETNFWLDCSPPVTRFFVASCTKPGSSTFPKVIPNKYPSIGYDYQSPIYPGLYFLGTLAHSLDFRKSAGGFIHGFRYSGE